jgi:hypothetical protein
VTGHTPEYFQAQLDKQEHKCAICRNPFGEYRAVADHDHVRKAPRGVLCLPCNVRLGFIEKTNLHLFVQYLAHWSSQ